jgi:hypothetical protein
MLKAAPCQPVTADSLNRLRQKLSALKSAKVAPSVRVTAEDGRENSHTATTHGGGAATASTGSTTKSPLCSSSPATLPNVSLDSFGAAEAEAAVSPPPPPGSSSGISAIGPLTARLSTLPRPSPSGGIPTGGTPLVGTRVQQPVIIGRASDAEAALPRNADDGSAAPSQTATKRPQASATRMQGTDDKDTSPQPLPHRRSDRRHGHANRRPPDFSSASVGLRREMERLQRVRTGVSVGGSVGQGWILTG